MYTGDSSEFSSQRNTERILLYTTFACQLETIVDSMFANVLIEPRGVCTFEVCKTRDRHFYVMTSQLKWMNRKYLRQDPVQTPTDLPNKCNKKITIQLFVVFVVRQNKFCQLQVNVMRLRPELSEQSVNGSSLVAGCCISKP